MNSLRNIVREVLNESELADYVEILVNGSYGRYIPQTFKERYQNSPELKSDKNLDEYWDDLDDVDNEYYWDSWNMILQSIELIIDGESYYVDYMDSDLVAIKYNIPSHIADELDF